MENNPNKKKTSRGQKPEDYGMAMGGEVSFAAAEAYRLLRTNLNFSLTDAGKCKVIGVTSTLRGEGKSTTAVNLAYTIAQTGESVLLLEADLRLPTAAKRLGVKAVPGLTNLLVGQCSGQEVLQKCSLDRNIRVITAGVIPPNPAELLNSSQMEEMIRFVSDYFDVVIVDLPPVSMVSDALIASRFLSGMIVVVREGMCGRSDLNETMRQLKFTDCKLLGFVMTDSGSADKRYYRKYKYGYGYGYGRRRSRKTEGTPFSLGREPKR